VFLFITTILLILLELLHICTHIGVITRIYNPKLFELRNHNIYFLFDMCGPLFTLWLSNDLPYRATFYFFMYMIFISFYDSYLLNLSLIILFVKDYINVYNPLTLLTIIHAGIHLFYVLTWKNGYYARRIQNWTSAEYSGSHYTADWFLTFYDITIHSIALLSLLSMKIFTD